MRLNYYSLKTDKAEIHDALFRTEQGTFCAIT